MLPNTEIKEKIRSGEWVAQPFSVLAEISRTCASNENLGRELLIRTLEWRGELKPEYVSILDSMAIQVGLYPYVKNLEALSLKGAIAHAAHRGGGQMDEVVLHKSQAKILYKLLAGNSIILSAPTSFGKSLLIDLLISASDYKNVVLIVPTLALVEETRRRMAKFSKRYSIISTNDQASGDQNIFVFTQERFLAHQNQIPTVDFFAIDEFYKLSITEDGDRSTQLNHALLRLLRTGAQFYMLGPSIGSIPEDVKRRTNCTFLVEDFQTVAVEIHQVDPGPSKDEAFIELADKIVGPTLVYCQSPASIRKLLRMYLADGDVQISEDLEIMEAAAWAAENYHDEWLVSVALQHGIGVHHGRLPRALGRFMIRAFEEGKIKILLCTSTLIEGVNTIAKNVILYDSKLNKRRLNFFTFNNIKGRSGRMFKHFVGHVYVFEPPPEQDR